MKTCVSCKQQKSEKDFPKKGNAGKLHSYCKPCLYSLQMQRWKDRKKDATAFLGGKCSMCGYDRNYAALHFHHVDPSSKEFTWTKLRLKSWDKIVKELKKCVILCGNCHTELHCPECKI